MPKPVTKTSSTEKDLPDTLKVYQFHHLPNLRWEKTNDDAYADCPFCGRTGKLGISIETTMFKCVVCDAKGNEYTFVRSIWDLSLKATNKRSYKALAEDSHFLSEKSLGEWQVAKHMFTDEWCVPGYNHEKKVTGLYRYVRMQEDGKWKYRLLPSPRLGHHLFGLNLYDNDKPNVALCEGWRDGIALYEVMSLPRGNNSPIINDWNVLPVPGTNSFKADWCKLLAGKNVAIMYDNDLPSENKKQKKMIEGAGFLGVKRVASILKSQPKDTQPASIQFLAWGGGDTQYNEKYKNKIDIRDFLSDA